MPLCTESRKSCAGGCTRCVLEAVAVVLETLEGDRCVLGAVKDVRGVLKVLEVVL